MGDPLFELEQVLRSKQETLTSQEANVLMTCRARVVKDFIIGAAASGGLAWLGAAALSGTWRSIRSLESCLEHILSLDGSRMQKELANILVKRHGDNPKIAQFLSKRFYSEKVFDDYSIDQPRLRWRYRNFFSDNLSPQRTHGENTDEPKLASETVRRFILPTIPPPHPSEGKAAATGGLVAGIEHATMFMRLLEFFNSLHFLNWLMRCCQDILVWNAFILFWELWFTALHIAWNCHASLRTLTLVCMHN
ncbi:uncharacterized protein LOC127800670 isoform X2 [Diospyros lotus]|uniref:uncharacterized protein LOC127800670 isoform X2 n=1 Tax=Diospyros lotus TaxID=55363 RepID=UPI0022599170|nr:uncharacterized protein LOC127800670 isoform X2 [Diospyros lotus]